MTIIQEHPDSDSVASCLDDGTRVLHRSIWSVRTAKEAPEIIARELSEGRLRQGWGAPGRDLRVLREKNQEGTLDSQERAIWKWTKQMLTDDPESMRPGDVVLTPTAPDRGYWALWEITGEYDFDPIESFPGLTDFGHIIPVRPLRGHINPHNAEVDPRLRSAVNNGPGRRRMRSLSDYGDQVTRLLTAEDVEHASPDEDRLAMIREATEQALIEAMSCHYVDATFERPVRMLLEHLYGVPVTTKAGRTEKGVDLLVEYTDPLGTPQTVAVQVKAYYGAARPRELRSALDQIRTAFANYPNVTSGIVFTLLDDLPPDIERASDELSGELGIPVRVLTRSDTAALFLRHLPDLTPTSA